MLSLCIHELLTTDSVYIIKTDFTINKDKLVYELYKLSSQCSLSC